MTKIESVIAQYTYQYDIMTYAIQMIKYPKVHSNIIHTFILDFIGSRLSAKTISEIRLWAIEFPLMCKEHGINVAINIVRHEPSGAKETFEELLGVAEDIYNIDINRNNANQTNNTLKTGNGIIKVFGIMSNRKKKTPKLGKARRGAIKDIEVNIFEEVTEIDEKHYTLVNQATGGSKVNIRVRIANPWVLSMWFVKSCNAFLQFNEKELRTKGYQFKEKIDKKTKTYRSVLITNHRVNSYLSEAQHQELYSLWNIDETLARVADLGMPGVAEGLIYAPIMDRILPISRNLPIQEFRAGLDWGTSTGENASSTAMVIGSITHGFKTLQIEREYFHSNSKMSYKSDEQLVKDIIDTLIEYYTLNKERISNAGGYLTLYYDYAAHALGGLLRTELASRKERLIADKIEIMNCYKYHVPVRIDIVKSLISQGRYKASRERTPYHFEELEGAMWDPSKNVDGRATRLNKDDHTLDAMEYLIGKDLYNFADTTYLNHNKLI